MKPNVNEKKQIVVPRALLLSGIIAVATVVIATAVYAGSIDRIERAERDAQVLDRLFQARRFNMLVKDLNSGHIAEAKQFAKLALESDLLVSKTLAANANPAMVQQAEVTVAGIEKSKQRASAQSAHSIQIAKH